jgi:hypothetical protein
MVVINTGNLKLKNVTADAPERLTSAGDCIKPNNDSTLDPGDQMSCTASVNMTTADIEAGNTPYTVGVSAASALGVDISSTRNVVITPMQLSKLSVSILACATDSTKPGTACLSAVT